MAKRSVCLLLALVTAFSLAAPAFAEGEIAEEPAITEEPVEITETSAEAEEAPVIAEVPAEVTEEPVEAPEAPVIPAEPAAEVPEVPVEAPEVPAEVPEPAAIDEPMTVADSCGDGVTYTLTGDGLLTISGNGAINGGAFQNRDDIKTAVIENGVTGIGEAAFADAALTSVTIPGSVKSIGIRAFDGCMSLTSVTIPEGVTDIEGYAFRGTGFTSVTVPASVTTVGLCAFGDFYSENALKDLTILNPNCTLQYSGGNGSLDPTIGITGSGVTIHGHDGSTAETYAKAFDFPFVSLDQAPGATPDDPDSGLTPVPTPEPTAKPAQPKVSKVTNAAEGVTVTWKAVEGAATYTVYSKTGTGKWNKLADTAETSYTWPKAKSGTKYSFSVSATNIIGSSKYNRTGKSITYMATPKVKSAKIDASGVKITWAKVNGAAKYQVMYKTGDGNWKVLAKSATGTSYTWKKAKSGTNYTFSVRAVAKDGSTGAYNETGKSLTYIAAPKVKSAKKVSGGIKITWAKVNGAAKYQVMYKVGNGKWKQLTATDKKTYTWKKAKNGTKYTFSVRAVAADGTKGIYNTTGKTLTYKK